jgi:hypothetical protein
VGDRAARSGGRPDAEAAALLGECRPASSEGSGGRTMLTSDRCKQHPCQTSGRARVHPPTPQNRWEFSFQSVGKHPARSSKNRATVAKRTLELQTLQVRFTRLERETPAKWRVALPWCHPVFRFPAWVSGQKAEGRGQKPEVRRQQGRERQEEKTGYTGTTRTQRISVCLAKGTVSGFAVPVPDVFCLSSPACPLFSVL